MFFQELMVQTRLVVDSVEAMIASMVKLGDSVTRIWEELLKRDLKLKKRDEVMTLLKIGCEKLLKAILINKRRLNLMLLVIKLWWRKCKRLFVKPRSVVLPPKLLWLKKIRNFKR